NTFEDDAINDDVNDDFELEITDLPASDEESRIPAAIAALRSRISFSAHSEEPGSEVVDDDFELEITDLPTTSADEDHKGRRIETRSASSVLRLDAPTDDVSA